MLAQGMAFRLKKARLYLECYGYDLNQPNNPLPPPSSFFPSPPRSSRCFCNASSTAPGAALPADATPSFQLTTIGSSNCSSDCSQSESAPCRRGVAGVPSRQWWEGSGSREWCAAVLWSAWFRLPRARIQEAWTRKTADTEKRATLEAGSELGASAGMTGCDWSTCAQ